MDLPQIEVGRTASVEPGGPLEPLKYNYLPKVTARAALEVER
jgi:hypothetical protein